MFQLLWIIQEFNKFGAIHKAVATGEVETHAEIGVDILQIIDGLKVLFAEVDLILLLRMQEQ